MHSRDVLRLQPITRVLFASVIAIAVFLAASASAGGLSDGDISGPYGGELANERELLYVNGFRTSYAEALEEATQVGMSLGFGAHLVWNDLTVISLDTWAMAIEKAGDGEWGVNAATDSLVRSIGRNAENGQTTWVVAYSAGSLSANNAVRRLAKSWEKLDEAERVRRLSTVRVMTIGGAVFGPAHFAADGWPKEVSIFEVSDVRDGVARIFGALESGEGFPKRAAHEMLTYLPFINVDCFAGHGVQRIDGDGLL